MLLAESKGINLTKKNPLLHKIISKILMWMKKYVFFRLRLCSQNGNKEYHKRAIIGRSQYQKIIFWAMKLAHKKLDFLGGRPLIETAL